MDHAPQTMVAAEDIRKGDRVVITETGARLLRGISRLANDSILAKADRWVASRVAPAEPSSIVTAPDESGRSTSAAVEVSACETPIRLDGNHPEANRFDWCNICRLELPLDEETGKRTVAAVPSAPVHELDDRRRDVIRSRRSSGK
jgi:hypothetical protein